ncbi:acyl-CoA reductase [Marinococcus halophilus]|uniref:acyl-CoA reductase n=1 Tax=Marinococcus halophilus TaxID=1371 RepID=UPI0009A706B8|nr:acyl-CoA reductase [Marinococcus halophilus]
MSVLYKAGFIPDHMNGELTYSRWTFKNHGKTAQVDVPVLKASQTTRLGTSLKKQQQSFSSHHRVDEIVNVLDQVVQKWLDPADKFRRIAEEALPVITGYDQNMIRLFLSRYLRRFRKENLQRFLEEDFSNPLVLDEFRPRKSGGLTRAYGAELLTYIFSGNVPGVPLWSLIAGMLVKSASIGKFSSAEPLFPSLFAQSIQEVSPELAENLAIVWWKGGDSTVEESVFHQSQVVVAYGNEQTMNNISGRVPPQTSFLPHGPKVSLGVVTKEGVSNSLAWASAKRAATDVSWFDQQGCLSPHVLYVEHGGDYSPKEFTSLLAQEMKNFQSKMPRAETSVAETNAILKVRTEAEFKADTDVLSSTDSTAWTVVWQEQQSRFPLSPLNRLITVIPIYDLEELKEKTVPIQPYVQTAGIVCPPQRFQSLINLLGECGMTRISFLGEMTLPEPGWHHDGRPNLGDLVYWCDVESSVEHLMEAFDPKRD